MIIRTGCNLNCGQCFVGNCKRSDYDIKKVLETVIKLKGEGYFVYPYPLEITYRYDKSDFESILELYRICGRKRALTNGVELGKTPSILEEIAKAGITELSIGNIEAVDYKTQEVLTGESKTFDYTVQGIKNAVSKGFKVGVYSVVSKANLYQIKEMCDFAKKLGASSIRFIRLVPIGKAKTLKELVLDKEETYNFLKEVIGLRKTYKKDRFKISLSNTLGPNMYSETTQKYIDEFGPVCFAANPNYVAVEPLKNQNLYYDCFFRMSKQPQSYEEFMNREIFDPNKLKGMCGQCEFKLRCGGGCRMLAYELTGDMYGSMDICQTKVIKNLEDGDKND